jgi:hypothetical protein
MGKSLRTASTSNIYDPQLSAVGDQLLLSSPRQSSTVYIDFYFVAFDFDGVSTHGHHGWKGARPAGLDVETSAMARALDLVAEDPSFAQRPAVVAANIVDGVEGATNVGDGHVNAVDPENAHFADRNIIDLSRPLKAHP